jgi:hypothetical protein
VDTRTDTGLQTAAAFKLDAPKLAVLTPCCRIAGPAFCAAAYPVLSYLVGAFVPPARIRCTFASVNSAFTPSFLLW